MRQRHNRGFSLVETLVVLGVTAVVTGAAMTLLAATKRASDAGQPMVERSWTRASALAEMIAGVQDAAARRAYFDARATMASVRGSGGGGGGGGQSGPPDGYCLVVASDQSTWPPGFDPRNSSTWANVAWWDGATREDPSTWYYDCGGKGGDGGDPGTKKTEAAGGGSGGGGGGIPHEFSLVPVLSYGTGIAVAGRTMVGPVLVHPEETGIGGTQTGEALSVLRAEAGAGTLRLGTTLATTHASVRLVARDTSDRARTELLQSGDILLVTGRDSAGTVRTSLVGLTSAPVAVALPTRSEAGTAVFQHYEATIAPPNSTFAGYLANMAATRGGAEYLEDASVMLLARSGAVVTYYTATGDDARAHLYRAVGSPDAPSSVERMVAGTATGLEVTTMPSVEGIVPPPAVEMVRIVVPVLAALEGEREGGAEPIEAEMSLLNGAGARPAATLTWDAMTATGSGGGGSDDGGGK